MEKARYSDAVGRSVVITEDDSLPGRSGIAVGVSGSVLSLKLVQLVI